MLGATLVPQAFPAKAGAAAVLSVAVFRKEPTPQAIALTQHSGDLYRMTAADEATMKKFLKSCSFVLVSPTNTAQVPRWFRIASSWQKGCYVVFADSGFASVAGTAPTVIAFDNLVRVDQYNVILQ